MSKGSKRRPRTVSRAEEDLRWAYATGEINHIEFITCYAMLKQDGLIRRSGRVLKW
jgi:uncharacterized membrane protein